MIQWLYKYIFRGIGLALLAGMLTALYVEINFHMHSEHNKKATANAPAVKTPASLVR